ncbi:MAG TPA: DHA2 family efflux MFS transporter permease subunit [Xanthobacteraceae bacterium]|nr:DHA2 family efflux MFS transporter permease subunit [Xanthobacteraceae bacterium]
MPASSEPKPKAGDIAAEGSHRLIISVCAMIATLMQALDNTIANVALPYMQGSLSTTPDQITWVLTSYVIAAAIMTAPVGWFSARFGRKNFFVTCLAGFTIASMLCGAASTLEQIVLFRVLQGAFGAALVPMSQSTMLNLFPVERRGSAMAVWGMGVMVGPILGPTLGGYLTDAYNWRWVFYINVPFGIAAIAGLWIFLKDNSKNDGLRFDWIGFAALSLGLAALQLFLDRGEQKDWLGSTEIVIYLVLCGLGFYLFAVHMWLADKPFIPRALFRDRNYVTALFVMFGIGAILLSTSAVLAPYLQTLGGYSVTSAGLLMAPRGLGTMAAMFLAGNLSMRMDPRILLTLGTAFLAYSLWQQTVWTPDVSVWSVTWTGVIQGFGLGFLFIPLNVIGFTTVPVELRTEATAILNLVRNVGSAIGISVSSFLLAQGTQINHAALAEYVTPFNRMLQTGGAYLFWNLANPLGLMAINGEVTRQAAIIAYANDFKFMLIISLPAAFLVWLMRRPARITPGTQPAAVMD